MPEVIFGQRWFVESTPKKSTSRIGALTEMSVSTALLKAGFFVYVPFFSPHSRIDLIAVGPDGKVQTVQCKTARFTNNTVTFHTCSNTAGIRRTYDGEVDVLGAYCEDTASVYLVPVENVPTRFACLRVVPPRNKQIRGIRWAERYVLGPP